MCWIACLKANIKQIKIILQNNYYQLLFYFVSNSTNFKILFRLKTDVCFKIYLLKLNMKINDWIISTLATFRNEKYSKNKTHLKRVDYF